MPFLPDVIQVGSFPLQLSALTALLGGVVAYWLAGGRAGAAGDGLAEPARDALANAFIGAIVGAKLVYLLPDLGSVVRNPASLLLLPYGPLAAPAAAAGAATGLVLSLLRRADRATLLDRLAQPMAAGLATAAIGWRGPGAWAYAPLLLAAAIGAGLAARHARRPGHAAAQAAVMAACALVLADLARPAAGGGGSGQGWLPLTAAILGTTAWWWRTQKAPDA